MQTKAGDDLSVNCTSLYGPLRVKDVSFILNNDAIHYPLYMNMLQLVWNCAVGCFIIAHSADPISSACVVSKLTSQVGPQITKRKLLT